MKVKNDFPNVDKVLRKLKEYTTHFRNLQTKTQDKTTIEQCKMALSFVDFFVDSIEKYLDSVCNGDMRIQRVKETSMNDENIKFAIETEDQIRTTRHSSIIESMIWIDRCSEKFGLSRVFDYAEEFQNGYSALVPNTIEEKMEMTERERIKRREMGNFGLYIAAAVTAGVSREASEITDDDLREFANCEGDKVRVDTDIFRRVKSNSHALKRNVNIMLDDEDNLPGGLT